MSDRDCGPEIANNQDSNKNQKMNLNANEALKQTPLGQQQKFHVVELI
jgi:hypothetical protein